MASVFAMKLFSIEGPIGIGKSTLLSELKKNGYPTYPEPIEEWTPVLKAFYHDRSKTAVDCQRFIYSSLINRHLRIWRDNYEVNIMERSLKASLDVFTAATKRASPSSNWRIVEKYGEGGMARYESGTRYIALHASFDTVYNRSRARGGLDTEADKEYLKEIYDLCVEFEKDCHAIVYVDGRSIESVTKEVIKILEQ